MRFLIQECLSSSGGGESSHSHVDKVQDGALEESKSRDESSTFAYVSAAWHPSGDVYACGDAAVVSHWQPQVQAQPDHHGLNLGGGLGAGAGAGGSGGGGGGGGEGSACRARSLGVFCRFDTSVRYGGRFHATSCDWHPRGDVLAVCCSQGSFKLVSRSGRVDKSVDGAHEGACVCIRWNLDGTALATGGEDGKVKLWSRTGMLRSVLASLDQPVYSVAFSPDSNLLALCCGKHIVVKRIGAGHAGGTGTPAGTKPITNGVVLAEEAQGGAGGPGAGAGGAGGASRSIRWKAHAGVVLALDWNAANGKIVSGGEDGKYKVWDQYGRMLYQSTPASMGRGGGGGSGGKGSGGGSKGASGGSGPIGSGADDVSYTGGGGPVMPVTSVRWRPDGESFAVGTFDLLLLCDESGWVKHKASPSASSSSSGGSGGSGGSGSGSGSTGLSSLPSSVLAMTWSADGTQLACTNGNGHVFIVMILGELKESGAISLTTEGADALLVSYTEPDQGDLALQTERLDFGDQKILLTSCAFDRVVVVTQKQMYSYQPPDWTTPQVIQGLFSPEMPLKLLVQAPACMAIVDTAGQLQVVSYEGRVMSAPKFQGMRAELMSRRVLALSDDVIAMIDASNVSQVRVFDTATGKPLVQKHKVLADSSHSQQQQGTVVHPQGAEIAEVGLSLVGSVTDRKVAFVDQNRDLYLALALDATRQPIKLCMMVDSFAWSSDSSALCAVSDGKLLVWAIPDICFLDQDLLSLCTYEVKTHKLEHLQRYQETAVAPRIKSFCRGRISTRHGNGALITYLVPLAWYSSTLERCVLSSKWPKAVHLCRTVSRCEGSAKGEQGYLLWACLAALAISAQHIETAKTAYASLGLIDKVQFMNFLKEVPSDEGRAAELALFKGVPPREVEGMLLNAGLHYRAIKLNIRMFHWERALELALKHDMVNIVLWHRRRYLLRSRFKEQLPAFIEEENKLGEVELVDEDIKAKIQQQKNKEVQRPAGMIRRSSISLAY